MPNSIVNIYSNISLIILSHLRYLDIPGSYIINDGSFDLERFKEYLSNKIPRSSISIPTIVNESYSPDFMYVVKKLDGTKELNIVVETKLVENRSILRGKENAKIKCAEIFFKQLTLDGYKVSFHTQLSNKKVKQIIEEVMKE